MHTSLCNKSGVMFEILLLSNEQKRLCIIKYETLNKENWLFRTNLLLELSLKEIVSVDYPKFHIVVK